MKWAEFWVFSSSATHSGPHDKATTTHSQSFFATGLFIPTNYLDDFLAVPPSRGRQLLLAASGISATAVSLSCTSGLLCHGQFYFLFLYTEISTATVCRMGADIARLMRQHVRRYGDLTNPMRPYY
jgi:hypothetical protein